MSTHITPSKLILTHNTHYTHYTQTNREFNEIKDISEKKPNLFNLLKLINIPTDKYCATDQNTIPLLYKKHTFHLSVATFYFFVYLCFIETKKVYNMLRKLTTFVLCLIATVASTWAQTPPINEIWYTTTDGKKAMLVTGDDIFEDDHDAKIISHTYSNNKGTIRVSRAITSYGCADYCEDGESSYGFYITGDNLSTISLPTCLEQVLFLSFHITEDIRFQGDLASSDGRCLIIKGVLEYFAGSNINEYTIPNGVTKISGDAFANYNNLQSITIPEGVTEIEMGAFAGCSGLTNITIPYGVTNLGYDNNPPYWWSVGSGVFQECTSLESITIPNSVKKIGWFAFVDCNSLTSITIPNSVTEIGAEAFAGCDNLQSVTILATTPPAIGEFAIEETTIIHVPKQSLKQYIEDANWQEYKKQIKPIE